MNAHSAIAAEKEMLIPSFLHEAKAKRRMTMTIKIGLSNFAWLYFLFCIFPSLHHER
jgi:hypothetical protein